MKCLINVKLRIPGLNEVITIVINERGISLFL